jgi:hypothetical protein
MELSLPLAFAFSPSMIRPQNGGWDGIGAVEWGRCDFGALAGVPPIPMGGCRDFGGG